jgi:hypothetical protein
MVVFPFLPFTSLSTFGSEGIDEGVLVPFLLRIFMRFHVVFIFIFIASCTVIACTFGLLIFPMLMSLVFSSVKDLINSSREGIFEVTSEENLIEWNVDTKTKNSGPILERMVITIFSPRDIYEPHKL